MAGVRDELPKLAGFPAGVNNVAPEDDAPDGSLREAVNVDLVGPSKKPRRRAGYTRVLDGRCHSPGAIAGRPLLFAVRNGDLTASMVRADGTVTGTHVLRAGLGARYVSYAEVNGDLYWSNGVQSGRVRGADLSDAPLWIDAPGVPDVDAVDDAASALTPGTYRVAVTALDAEGAESGADGLAEIDIAAGQGIAVRLTGVPAGAARLRVYVSPANVTEELFAAADLYPSTTLYMLTEGAGQDGRALDTLWRRPLPPCEILRFWNGRVLGASGNLLVWSDALRFGLTTTDNYMRVGAKITLLEPVGEGGDGAGCWLADHKNTYWMAGATPTTWRRVIRYDAAAVPGTSTRVKGTAIGLETTEYVAVWLAANGVLVAGLPGGTVVPLTEGRLALPAGEAGATLLREYDGMRQLVLSFISAGGNGLAVGDSAAATVTRHP